MNRIILITSGELQPSLEARLLMQTRDVLCISPQAFSPGEDPVFPGTLSCEEREKLMAHRPLLFDLGDGPGSLIVPGAVVAPSAVIDPLCLVQIGAVIGEGARIGPGCIIETGAVIGAGAVIGGFTTVGTGAVIARNVTLSPRQRIRPGECVAVGRGMKKVLANGRWIRSEKPK